MNEPPQLLRPGRHTSSGQSPTRHRWADDILASLSPTTAVDALMSGGSGALGMCMAAASPAEREFAMQCAVASKNIWDWLDELQDWAWPAYGGSGGFIAPSERARDPFAQGTGESYVGSLSTRDMARYELRLEDIYAELEELGVEEIKSHVMTNHILPLSRPTTPMSDRRSMSSTVSNYNKMEDLTAVVTAIVVQTLPNLAKLDSLMRIWSVRLSVLERVPALLIAIERAEQALESGWTATSVPKALPRSDFNVMKSVVDDKLSVPGKHLDFMLDRLEGYLDTLPDEWIDRVDALERGYADWVAFCERKVRSADWTRSIRSQEPVEEVAPRSKGLRVVSVDGNPAITLPVPETGTVGEPSKRGVPILDGQDDEPYTVRPPTPDDLHLETSFSSSLDGPRTPEGSSGDELELPPLRDRQSNDSLQSVLHASSQFDLSSDLPEVSASPDIRLRARAKESPPSSPPYPDSIETSIVSSNNPTETGRDADEITLPRTPVEEKSFSESFFDDSFTSEIASPAWQRSGDHLQQQISDIVDNIPKIKLTKEPPNLNPPDLQLPKLRKRPSKEPFKRSMSSLSNVSARTATPSFTLSPAKNPRPKSRTTQRDIKVYHLSRSTGEAPIKLFIRCVGENGERVMVRVGGGWADLSEYLKEYASHHGRRGADKKIEVRVPRDSASPPSRPASALDSSPLTPLTVRKTRRGSEAQRPAMAATQRIRSGTPGLPSLADASPETRSRSNSRLSWVEDDSSFLGLAGPSGKKVEMSEENKAWVESVKEKVRLASGEMRIPSNPLPALQPGQQQRARSATPDDYNKNKFGELGKVGGTKRIFRRADGQKKAP